MPENDFLNQSPEDFLSYNPEDFLTGEQQVIEDTRKENSHLKTELAVAVGIGVAFLVWRAIAKRKLKELHPQSKDDAFAALKMIFGKTAPAWMQIATPVIASAYQIGSKQVQLSDRQLEEIAKEYTASLGKYLSATSDNAVLEGFAAQLNKNVNPSVAWERSVEGYGLDSQQMRSYVTQATSNTAEYQTESVPRGLHKIIDKLLHSRADRVARHEAWASMTMGKNIVWLYQQEMGILPKDAMKMWITAEDERVCPVCAPLDQVQVPINEKFESESGSFWVPGVHVNCRCNIKIVLPDEVHKAWDASEHPKNKNDGRFAFKPKTATKEQSEEYSMLSDWINTEVNTPEKESAFSEPTEKVNAFGVKQSAFSAAKQSAFSKPKESAFGKPAEAKTNSFTKPAAGKKRKVVTWIIVNGKKPKKVEYDIEGEVEPYEKQDGKVAFVPYYGFKSRFQGREHKIKNPWSKGVTEQIADIDSTDLDEGVIPVISNAYVEDNPVPVTGDEFADNGAPESLKLAIKDSLAQSRDWLLTERSYQSLYYDNPELHHKVYDSRNAKDIENDFYVNDEGGTIGVDDKTYNFTPVIVGFSDFYSVNQSHGDSESWLHGDENVAGKYKISMAEPSWQEGEYYNDNYTESDENKFTFRLSVKDFQELYNDLSNSKIRWTSPSSSKAVYDEKLADSFPELFFDNPWRDDRWVTLVYAQPTEPPKV